MQAIMETTFDVVYLITVVTLGIIMIMKNNGKKQYLLFGVMAVTLGVGDSFHLVPRAIALCTTGLENYTFALGIGKFITSITMTIFYILLYYVWRLRYKWNNISYIFIINYTYNLMFISAKWLDKHKCTFKLGNLSKYTFCFVRNIDNYSIL